MLTIIGTEFLNCSRSLKCWFRSHDLEVFGRVVLGHNGNAVRLGMSSVALCPIYWCCFLGSNAQLRKIVGMLL